jgi:ribosome recycling factor
MQLYLDEAKQRMNKALESLDEHFLTVRTGRASTSIVSEVLIPYYGTDTPLNQLAQISVVEGTQLMIKPFDPNAVKDIEKAIFSANLGLTPQNDGSIVRINVPKLTEETRRDLAKDVHKMGEEAKVAVRNIRRDVNDSIKKDDELSEDVARNAHDQIQKITDEFTKKIDQAVESKTNDIMKV